MVGGLIVVMSGALVLGLLSGWLVARFWRRGPVLGAAAVLALAAFGAMVWIGQGDFRQSMQAAILGFGGLSMAAGLLLGGLAGRKPT